MTNFDQFALPEVLKQSLARMNFTTPTDIQTQSIPLALNGRDILGTSQTGSGKTAAFALPLLAHLIANPTHKALVLTPTRELATQVLSVIEDLLPKESPSNIRKALLIGGDSMFKQINQLRANPRIIVGTPGRVFDHMKRRSIRMDTTKFLVLDETDRMLDIGMGVQIEQIVAEIPKERQTLLFSATLSRTITNISQKYLNNPERISAGTANTVTANIKQESIEVNGHAKYKELLNQLNKREGSIIVFVKTKHSADSLATKLRAENHFADTIHGDLQQRKRERVIAAFRNKNFRVLVATDVAARGIDIPHIEHVINYDLPQCPEDYIHRIGRTARGGAEGCALSFISGEERGKWRAITRLLDPNDSSDGSSGEGYKSGGGGGFRKQRSGGFGGGDRNNRFGGDRNSRGGDRGGRSFAPREGYAPRDRAEGSSEPRREGNFSRERTNPRTEFNTDRPQRTERSFDRADRPQRSFNDRPQRSDRPANTGERSFAPRERREGASSEPRREGGYSSDRSFGNRDRKPSFARTGDKRKSFGSSNRSEGRSFNRNRNDAA